MRIDKSSDVKLSDKPGKHPVSPPHRPVVSQAAEETARRDPAAVCESTGDRRHDDCKIRNEPAAFEDGS